MTQPVVVTEHNVMIPVSVDANGDVVTDPSGNQAVSAFLKGDSTTPIQSQYYVESVTTVAAATTAILTTSDLTVLGIPYKTLIFTKTGVNAVCTVNIQASNMGMSIYISTTTDTMAITATNANGDTMGTVNVSDAGTVGAATGLTTGHYTLSIEK